VDLPAEEVPPELPEPALGINFARDGMQRADWLALVAVHADTWLIAVAFYNGARLNQAGRERLFHFINELPTCYEVVSGRAADCGDGAAVGGADGSGDKATTGMTGTGTAGKRGGPGTAASGGVRTHSKSGREGGGGATTTTTNGAAAFSGMAPITATPPPPQPLNAAMDAVAAPGAGAGGEQYADGEGDPCPRCGRVYRVGEFWIACDACDTWYDGDCVGMTAAKAQRMGTWKCPGCQ
jgi:hypothetical protein